MNTRSFTLSILLFALAATAPSRAEGLTEFYVDPDFAGSLQNGSAANPWTHLASSPREAQWIAINSALVTHDVINVITGNDFHANHPDYGWPFRAADDPALAGQNLALDPLFANPADPAGPDGKFFTADDGFVPKALVAGPTTDGRTRIGYLPSNGKMN